MPAWRWALIGVFVLPGLVVAITLLADSFREDSLHDELPSRPIDEVVATMEIAGGPGAATVATAVHEEKSSAEQPVAGKSGKGKGPKQLPEEQVPKWFAQVMDTFQVIDRDGDGLIVAAELRHVLTESYEGVTDEVLQGLMVEADADGDGQIGVPELAQLDAPGPAWAALLDLVGTAQAMFGAWDDRGGRVARTT